MQTNNIYPQKEPRRVIISPPKISIQNGENKVEQLSEFKSNWESDSKYIDIIKATYKNIPLDKKIIIVKEYFENKEMPSVIGKKFSLDVTIINNFIARIKNEKLFNYIPHKIITKKAIKKPSDELILSIIKEKEDSGCLWKELAIKHNIDYMSLMVTKQKILRKECKIYRALKHKSVFKNSEEKIKNLESEIVRLNRIIDSLIK